MKVCKFKTIQRTATLFVGLVFVGVMMASPVAALGPQDVQSANTDSPWFDICSANGTPTSVGDWKTVGASMYGGKYDGSNWSPNNGKQGGGGDDTGMDNIGGILGTGVPVGSKPDAPAQFAELDNGEALGKLDEHTKLEIKYKNKVIIAQRDDIGGGGPDVKGKHRAVDLWWETAKLLKFTDGLDTVEVRVAADQNQSATPLNGKPKDVDQTADTGAGGCCQNTGAAGNVALVGKDNATKAYNYFVGTQHLTAAQASGIIGNLQQESGVNPKSVQGGGGPGRGIAQWSAGGRWEELKKHESGKDIYDLATQLDFIWYEMNNVSPWKSSLKGSKDPNYPSLSDIKGDSRAAAVQAGKSFGKLYEAFGVSGSRDTYAGDWWQKHHTDKVSGADAADGTCQGSSGLCAGAPAGWVQNTNKVVDSACTEWGKKVVEDGPRDNCDKAGNIAKYTKVGTGNGCGESWCGDFVAYNYKVAGHAFPGSSGVASVPRVISYFQGIGARRGPSTDPKPGDVVTYDEEHEGLVVGVDTKDKVVTTIEGNTGPDSKKIDAVNTSGKEGVHMHHRHYPSGASVPAGGSSNGQSGWGDYDVLISKQKK